MNIEQYIDKFREENWIYPWKNNFCYVFARVLQVKFWGVVYSNIDHCKLKIWDYMYDIDWKNEYDPVNLYTVIDEHQEARYKTYENFTIN